VSWKSFKWVEFQNIKSLPGLSLRLIRVTWIPVGSCSPEWADFVGGQRCGLGWLPHFWCGLGRPRCGGGFCGMMLHSVLGLSVDTELSSIVRNSDSPLVWVAQKPRGGSLGPWSAGVYIRDGCCQWLHGQPAVWDGLLWLGGCLWGSTDPMDPMLNLAVPLLFRGWVIAWSAQRNPISHQYTWAGGSCAFCYSCHELLVPSICWEFSGDGWWTRVAV